MGLDAWSPRKAMATSSEMRRRAAAALVDALEANPDVADRATHDALRMYVDALVHDGLLPEAAVIAFKETIVCAHSLQRFEPELREQLRASLVSKCIERYFVARGSDDARPPEPPRLEIVRGERYGDRPRPSDSAR